MNRTIVKAWLVVAQIMPVVTLLELVVRHTLWSAPFTLLAILLVATLRCLNCGPPLRDGTVIGRRIPLSSRALEQCPRCGQPMFGA